MLARVIGDERTAGSDDELAERMGKRRAAFRGQRLAKTGLALEELLLVVDQRHKGDGNFQDALGQRGEAVEDFLGRAVDQRGCGEGLEAFGIVEDVPNLGDGLAIGRSVKINMHTLTLHLRQARNRGTCAAQAPHSNHRQKAGVVEDNFVDHGDAVK